MSKKDKMLARLRTKPKDFSFDETRTLLENLGFEALNQGKTGGSRIRFAKDNIVISLHKPHPRKELREYQIKQILETLEREGMV
jgi:predicted RNA binding protein YcfA (HicA-like mRNA interferase family)